MMAKQGLNGSDIRTPLEQVSGEIVPESVRADTLLDICPTSRGFDGFLNHTWFHMMTALTSSRDITTGTINRFGARTALISSRKGCCNTCL